MVEETETEEITSQEEGMINLNIGMFCAVECFDATIRSAVIGCRGHVLMLQLGAGWLVVEGMCTLVHTIFVDSFY